MNHESCPWCMVRLIAMLISSPVRYHCATNAPRPLLNMMFLNWRKITTNGFQATWCDIAVFLVTWLALNTHYAIVVCSRVIWLTCWSPLKTSMWPAYLSQIEDHQIRAIGQTNSNHHHWSSSILTTNCDHGRKSASGQRLAYVPCQFGAINLFGKHLN